MDTAASTFPHLNEAAPAFNAKTTHGDRSLADYKGKWLVLEWLNHGCPYVRKHYDAKNMQALQAKWTDKGVAWLSVIFLRRLVDDARATGACSGAGPCRRTRSARSLRESAFSVAVA